MKIAIVCFPTFGGSGVVATELGLAFADKGHEIHFVTYQQPVRLAQLNKNVFFHEVQVPDYPLFNHQPYDLALSSKLVNVIRKHQIDVLHVHYAIPNAYAAYMAKTMLKDEGYHIPIITTLHGTDVSLVGSHPFYKPAVAFSINHSDCVTAVSHSLKNMTYDMFDIQRSIEVIPNFIDASKYEKNKTKPCKRHLVALPEERILTHVSNFRKVKRIPDVIRIFEKVSHEVPSKLVMVGDGPEKLKAKKLVDKLGLSDKVHFLGNSSEIDRILCWTDLFLLPSEIESFGLSALEAMANKCAVVSSNAGGLPEVNQNGTTGFLNDIGDIEGMAASAIHILEDGDRLKEFKDRAQEYSFKFDIKVILPLYEAIYDKAYRQARVNQKL